MVENGELANTCTHFRVQSLFPNANRCCGVWRMMAESLSSSGVWAEFRRQMPVTQRWAYFDHAAVAPLPAAARDALIRYAQQAADEGDTAWPAWNRRVEEVHGLAARLIGADPDEIALVRNTTEGINLVAEGFAWQAGDNVVTLDNEFPSNQYPWMNLASRSVETRRVATDGGRVDLDQLAEACDRRTRIVSVSWVGYASGWRTDPAVLAEMVHAHGALLFVDAIQGLVRFRSTSMPRALIFWRPTDTSGCLDRREPGCSMCARNISSGSGRWASAGIASCKPSITAASNWI